MMQSQVLRPLSSAMCAAALFVVAACGGRQSVEETAAPEPDGCCYPDRWENPPREIGQTPPDREAPADALDLFQTEPADSQASGATPAE